MKTLLLSCRFKEDGKMYVYKLPKGLGALAKDIDSLIEKGELPEGEYLKRENGQGVAWSKGRTQGGIEVTVHSAFVGDTNDYSTLAHLGSAETLSKGGDLYELIQEKKAKVLSKKKEKGETKTMKKKTGFGGMVRKIEDFFAFAMTGQTAVRDGLDYFAFNGSEVSEVSDFVMGEISYDGYGIPSPVSDLREGDIILHGDKVGFFLSHNDDGTIFVILTDGTIVSVSPLLNPLFGNIKMVQRVMNPMAGFGGNQEGGQGNGMGMGGNLLPMMLLMDKDGEGDKMDKMMKLSLVQSMGGQGQGGMNPMFLMAMMKDDGEDDSLTKLMLMQQMQGGWGGQ